MESYHVLPIALALLSAYLGSIWLVRTKALSLCAQRRIWNIALLVFFVGSAFGGLVLAGLIDQGIRIPWYGTLLWLHVESGVGMTLVGLFHALWHTRYYLRRTPPTRSPDIC